MKPIHWRRTRLGNYLRHIPRPKHLKGSWLHRRLGEGLLHPDLWRPERTKVAAGFAVGAFFSMIPMPFQMLPTLLLGYFTRVNLAAALVAVWVSNPITSPPIFYAQYKIGHWMLGHMNETKWDGTTHWLDLLKEAPMAILLGGVVTGVLFSAVSYPIVLFTWDALTRWVMRAREKHAKTRSRRRKSTPP